MQQITCHARHPAHARLRMRTTSACELARCHACYWMWVLHMNSEATVHVRGAIIQRYQGSACAACQPLLRAPVATPEQNDVRRLRAGHAAIRLHAVFQILGVGFAAPSNLAAVHACVRFCSRQCTQREAGACLGSPSADVRTCLLSVPRQKCLTGKVCLDQCMQGSCNHPIAYDSIGTETLHCNASRRLARCDFCW